LLENGEQKEINKFVDYINKNRLGVLKTYLGFTGIKAKKETLIFYAILYIVPFIIEIKAGSIYLLITLFLNFITSVSFDYKYPGSWGACKTELKEIPCCGSHLGTYLMSSMFMFYIYISKNNKSRFIILFLTFLYLIGMIIIDTCIINNNLPICFQLDFHASWFLQSLIIFGLIYYASNPYKLKIVVFGRIIFAIFIIYIIFGIILFKIGTDIDMDKFYNYYLRNNIKLSS
ncbi:unnamed protein product, partial [marine sediment metagenome]